MPPGDTDEFGGGRVGGPTAGRTAAERVALPAALLMTAGGLGLGLAVVYLALAGAGDWDPAFPGGDRDGRLVGGAAGLVWGAIVLGGGLQMKRLRGRRFVTFAAVWAMLPCSPCFVLGAPSGVWALMTLGDESVKRAF